jgi:hypothetical protein
MRWVFCSRAGGEFKGSLCYARQSLLPSGNVSFPAGFVRGSTPPYPDMALNGIWPYPTPVRTYGKLANSSGNHRKVLR